MVLGPPFRDRTSLETKQTQVKPNANRGWSIKPVNHIRPHLTRLCPNSSWTPTSQNADGAPPHWGFQHYGKTTPSVSSFDNGSIWIKWRCNSSAGQIALHVLKKSLSTSTSATKELLEYYHDDVMKHFPRYWLFAQGIHRSPVNSSHQGQWRGPLMFSLICVWRNGWVNNREAGDLRCHHAHYDVIVMLFTHVVMRGGVQPTEQRCWWRLLY